MKTSFYLVLWIVIDAILWLIPDDILTDSMFFIELTLIIATGWILKIKMQTTLNYERNSKMMPILEAVYTGNVKAFVKRLRKKAITYSIFTLPILGTTVVIAYFDFEAGMLLLIIFVILSIRNIMKCISYWKALVKVKSNSTAEQCLEIAQNVMLLDYISYYDVRQAYAYEQIVIPRPRQFKSFTVLTILMAFLCSIIGLYYIASSIWQFFTAPWPHAEKTAAGALLLGLWFSYYGIKDFFNTLQSINIKTVIQTNSDDRYINLPQTDIS